MMDPPSLIEDDAWIARLNKSCKGSHVNAFSTRGLATREENVHVYGDCEEEKRENLAHARSNVHQALLHPLHPRLIIMYEGSGYEATKDPASNRSPVASRRYPAQRGIAAIAQNALTK